MKSSSKIIILVLTFLSSPSFWAQSIKNKDSVVSYTLPNGWKLSPAGRSLPLGDLPLNMALSKNGEYLAVTNNGESTQSLQLIDPKNEVLLDSLELAESWYGLTFSKNSKHLYVSGGNKNYILDFRIKKGKIVPQDTISLGKPWPKNKISPTGIAVTKNSRFLYAVTKEDNSVYKVELPSGKILDTTKLPVMAYSCKLSPKEGKLYVSLWGKDEVAVYNTQTTKVEKMITVGSHPNEMLLNKKGTLLFVANANDNSVSVINTASNKVLETLSTSLYPTDLTGSTTNGIALSEDENTLYIANADNNNLAVFDVSNPGNSKSKGFIPVGWYPTNVKVSKDKILVTNGKGFSSQANPYGPQPVSKEDNSSYQKGDTTAELQYIGSLFKGTLSFIEAPDAETLKTYTKQVYANTPFRGNDSIQKYFEKNPIPSKPGGPTPIKYVFYIIKENRTYDQIMGDVKKGNGEDSLCIFGRRITPNHHAIANDFVLLDNFYVDAEVSADGHNWSTAAYATDVVEKTWPTYYGNRGGNYYYEGQRKAAYPRDGFIWDYCQRNNVSYRSYGEFGEFGKANIDALEGHVAPHSPGFDLTIKDQVRYDAWAHDFDSLVEINKVPRFNTVRFPNDHTSGQHLGSPTPRAAVADNDLALGKFLDHLSHSPIWKESVVFVLEDDAQNGPDHVDAHRSPVFVAGPYVKRDTVIHTMYSTSGVLHTIELILGLPPMSQYDAAAVPLYDCFTSTPNYTPYTFKPANVDLDKRNVAINESSKKSANFKLAHEDEVNDLELNRVVWKAVKGEDSEMPAPKRSAFVILEDKHEDEDD